jgi:hypothetical protein
MKRFLAACTLSCFLGALGGCGTEPGEARGRVTHQGQPVTGGTVVMAGEDGIPRSGPIDAEGNYLVHGVPRGTVQVAVTNPAPGLPATAGRIGKTLVGGAVGAASRRAPGAGPGAASRNGLPIPSQYTSLATSGLTTTIEPGENVFDIELN